jgi:RNA polymerase sigma-70 factor (ECF subfamily)
VCRRLLGSSDAAEDATHEVFLRARRGIASFEPGLPFRPWLLGIAGHLCLDRLRRRRTEARLFDARNLDGDDLADLGASPLRQVVREEERRGILRAIDALPLKYRLPLVLRYFNDLDYDAIADVLGVTRNQVGTLLFRARRWQRRRRAPLTSDSTNTR